jgi:hypothetical protein
MLPDMSGASALDGEIMINLGFSDRRREGTKSCMRKKTRMMKEALAPGT